MYVTVVLPCYGIPVHSCSHVPSKKEDLISGCDGEFSVTLMVDAVRCDQHFVLRLVLLIHMSREISFADTKPFGVVFFLILFIFLLVWRF